MKLIKASTIVGSIAFMGALLIPSARADEWNKKTVITFSGPVEIPGVHQKGWGVLPAGTYVFKLLDSQNDRHIVQIFSQDEKTCIATILAIPNFRLKSTDKTVMTFSERPAGEPEALRAWFYPGRQYGDEFVYPKSRAVEIAKITNTPVLYAVADLPVEVAEPIQTASAPAVVELKHTDVMAVQPTGEQVELAAVVTTPPPAQLEVATTTMPAADALPSTASTTPLFGLIGLIALAGALSFRAIEKRRR